MFGRFHHALALLLPLSFPSCKSTSTGGIPAAILTGCVAENNQFGRPDYVGNIRFGKLVDVLQGRHFVLHWEPGADDVGIIRTVQNDALTGRTTTIGFEVAAKPATDDHPDCSDGATLVSGMEVNGERMNTYEISSFLGGLIEKVGEDPMPPKPQPAPAAPPPAPPPPSSPATSQPSASDQQEEDEDNNYYASLAPYREFKVRVAAADGAPACCLTLGTMIDRLQDGGAEIRIDASSNDHLDLLVMQHQPDRTDTTRFRFMPVDSDPGHGWRLDSIADATGRDSYSTAAASYARKPDAYLVATFGLKEQVSNIM